MNNGETMENWRTKEVVLDGKVTFEVPEHLDLIKKVGSGAYGCVASFQDTKTNSKVGGAGVRDHGG